MVTLYKNNRKVRSFANYEAARQYARASIRRANPEWVLFSKNPTNPNIAMFGFRIKEVQ